MAKRRGERLTVLYSVGAVPIPAAPAFSPVIPTETFDETPRAFLDEGVRRASALLGDESVTGTVLQGGASANLVEASRSASLVVTGSRGRGRVEAGLLGSVSYAVTAHAHCPAVVVRGENPEVPGPDHQVVVGVDDSASSERALDAAAEVAEAAGAPLLVVSVGTMHSPESWAYAETASAGTNHTHAVTAEAEEAVQRAKDRVSRSHPQLAVETNILFGHAGHVMAELGRDAGLLVVGSRGRGGFTGLLLGSVSHAVIHEADCPVMVVHD
jgi:nucleotide-binding universal stress UspA family protein